MGCDDFSCRNDVDFVFLPPPKAGSPRHASSPCVSRLLRGGSRRNSETEAMCATPDFTLMFYPPELPEDTLMEVIQHFVVLLQQAQPLASTPPMNRCSVPVLSPSTAVPHRWTDRPALHFGFRPLRNGVGSFQESGHVCHHRS